MVSLGHLLKKNWRRQENMSERIINHKCPICGGEELYFTKVVDGTCYYEQSAIFCNRCKAIITSENIDGTTEKDKEILLRLISGEKKVEVEEL